MNTICKVEYFRCSKECYVQSRERDLSKVLTVPFSFPSSTVRGSIKVVDGL
jgi:hypothetical protein